MVSGFTRIMGFMNNDFPHLILDGANAYPVPASDPAPYERYQNTFDYSLWVVGSRVELYSVDWDGERDAPMWESGDARNSWFDGRETVGSVTLEASARADHGVARVPLPYDVCACANYVRIVLPSYPVAGEAGTGLKQWFYYIRDVEYLSPNATELTIEPDWWVTCFDRLQVPRLRLAQGHWAVDNSATPTEYCTSPMTHTTNLMDNEGDYEPQLVMKMLFADQFNKDRTGLYAVVDIGAANPQGDYTAGIPGNGAQVTGGLLSGTVIAMQAENLVTWLNSVSTGIVVSIRCIWICPQKFLALGESFTLAGVAVWPVAGGNHVRNDIEITPDSFGYPDFAADFTKLYTSQYAQIEIVTDDGNVVNVRPESIGTNGVVYEELSQVCDDALRITGWLVGIGESELGSGANQTIAQIGTVAECLADLGWHGTQNTWDCPMYMVSVDNDRVQDWFKAPSRSQAYSVASTTRDNATDSAYTAYYNSVDSANNAHTVAYSSAETNYNVSTANAALVRTNAARQNTQANDVTAAQNSLTSDTTSETNATNTTINNQAMQRQMYQAGIVSDNSDVDPYGIISAGHMAETNINATGNQSTYWRGSNLWALFMNAYADEAYNNAVTQINAHYENAGLAAGVLTNTASSVVSAGIAGAMGGPAAGATALAGAVASIPINAASATISASNITGKSVEMSTTYDGYMTGYVRGDVEGQNPKEPYTPESNFENLRSADLTYFNDYDITFDSFGTSNTTEWPIYYGKLSISIWNNIVQNFWARRGANQELSQRNLLNTTLANLQTANNTAINTINTTTNTDIANNNATTAESNAALIRANSKSTADSNQDTSVDNAYRTLNSELGDVAATVGYTGDVTHVSMTGTINRTYETAVKAIERGIESDNRGAPVAFGVCKSGTWGSRTQGVLIRTVRPDDGSLHRIVDRFTRYGYRCDRIVEEPDLTEMGERGYSYWRVSEMWLNPSGLVPMRALDAIKGMFIRGIILKQES